jgi:enoyl-CoA hydratase
MTGTRAAGRIEPVSSVLAQVQGRLGRITLDRPERINALSLSMIEEVMNALTAWADDPMVSLLLIEGSGERGLCAGGDIRSVYEAMTGHNDSPVQFWGLEYEMNAWLASYPKPVVAFMDGIVFGGGVGISAHCSVRVVTERSQVAMPETAIGLSPDVGALYLLARSPGRLGVHAALTGHRFDGPGAIHAGLADYLVESRELPALADDLASGVPPALAVPETRSHPEWIDECYAEPTVEKILAALRQRPESDAAAAAETLERMSPTALKVTLAAITRAADLTVEEVLDQDLRVCSRFLMHPDFREGIRAQIIDKDRNPRWDPADLEAVDDATVQSFFEPL